MRGAAQYLASLRDGRAVFLDGARVDDVTRHPAFAESAQRKPGAGITATAKAEVDYLLSRVARVDKRANLQPQSSAAG